MKNNWLFKTYMSFPLWAKIAAPLLSVLLVMSLFKLMKAAVGLALLGGIAYVVIMAYNKYNAGKES